jgi:hypothetical protein
VSVAPAWRPPPGPTSRPSWPTCWPAGRPAPPPPPTRSSRSSTAGWRGRGRGDSDQLNPVRRLVTRKCEHPDAREDLNLQPPDSHTGALSPELHGQGWCWWRRWGRIRAVDAASVAPCQLRYVPVGLLWYRYQESNHTAGGHGPTDRSPRRWGVYAWVEPGRPGWVRASLNPSTGGRTRQRANRFILLRRSNPGGFDEIEGPERGRRPRHPAPGIPCGRGHRKQGVVQARHPEVPRG